MRAICSASILSLLLAACTIGHPPSPYLPPREGIVPGQTITVGGSQNVYAVAQEYHVSMRDIIVLNDLHPPFALKPGQQLLLPAAPGEVPSDASASMMSGGGSYLPPAMGSSPSYDSGGPVAPAPGSAAAVSVQQENLAPIQTAPVSSAPAASTQGGVRYQNVPQSQGGAPSAPNGAPTADQLSTPSPVRSMSTTASSPQAAPAPAPVESSEAAKPGFAMQWPVQGPILSGFGPKGQGLSNDGVNIGAPKGSPVVAAANGVVVYAGNEMKGFGNLVLIRHEGGWVTAYAHLDRMLVTKDSIVAQGDEIGTVGKTGNVGSPQLHFETRFGGKPVDPAGVVKK